MCLLPYPLPTSSSLPSPFSAAAASALALPPRVLVERRLAVEDGAEEARGVLPPHVLVERRPAVEDEAEEARGGGRRVLVEEEGDGRGLGERGRRIFSGFLDLGFHCVS